jgi:hypothetical protein
VIFVTLAIACVFARPEVPAEDIEAFIESADFTANQEGGYKHSVKTSNNIKLEEESDGTNIVEGSYSYVDPDGKLHVVKYIAGAGIGFKPIGEDIHPDVSAAVELNLKNPPQEEKDRIF